MLGQTRSELPLAHEGAVHTAQMDELARTCMRRMAQGCSHIPSQAQAVICQGPEPSFHVQLQPPSCWPALCVRVLRRQEHTTSAHCLCLNQYEQACGYGELMWHASLRGCTGSMTLCCEPKGYARIAGCHGRDRPAVHPGAASMYVCCKFSSKTCKTSRRGPHECVSDVCTQHLSGN